jgi:hypothetical protein
VDAGHDLASSTLCKCKFEFVALMFVSMQEVIVSLRHKFSLGCGLLMLVDD